MTKALDFPIPYPGQLPDEDLASARMMLNAVAFSMENAQPISSPQVQSLFFVLCAAMEKLEVVQLFLDDCDCPNLESDYLAARRLWVMQKGGAK